MKRRVVVTGMGAITPIGNTVDEFWQGIKEEKVGIGELTKFDTENYKVKLAAEVKGFVAKERMDFKSAKRMDTFSQYAVVAVRRMLPKLWYGVQERSKKQHQRGRNRSASRRSYGNRQQHHRQR